MIILGLILQFTSGTATAQLSTAPFRPVGVHFMDPSKVKEHSLEIGQGHCQNPVPKSIPTAQKNLEKTVANSVFTLEYPLAENPGYTGLATGFLVGDDLMATNKHVIKGLFGKYPDQVDANFRDLRLRELEIRSDALNETLKGAKFEYCLSDRDVCFIRISHTKNGMSAGSQLPILKFKSSLESLTPRSWIGVVGNINGQGLQGSADHPVTMSSYGLLFHCIPTSAFESGGNSGSPVFDQTGAVVGIDAFSLALDSHCTQRSKTTGAAISSSTILSKLKTEKPALYHELDQAQ
jgi:S1-C subfamily serine protease